MNIYILSNRDVVYQSDFGGIKGENNAEIMHFHFPEQIVGIDLSKVTKWIQFKNEELDLIQMIENDQYSLTDLITQYENVKYEVLLKYNELILWKSRIAELDFDESLDVNVTITIDELSVLNQLRLQVIELKNQYEELLKNGNQDITDLIKKIEDLESKINKAEEERKTAEKNRVIAENGRVQAETERNQTLADLVKEVESTISRLAHSIEEYNQNAETQIGRLESTANGGVSEINSAKSSALSSISNAEDTVLQNIESKETSSIKTISDKTTEMIQEISDNTESQISEFDTNVQNKIDAFNSNATSKTTAFDENATSKTNSFNDNVSVKTESFNQNYENKVEEINSELSINRIESLENEVFEKQTIISESNGLAIQDTEEGLNLSINEIESNKLVQVTTSVSNGEYDSPSPSNPSEVEGVTGDIKVAVKNKNVASNVKYFNALKEYAGAIFADVQYHKDKYYIVSFDTPNSGDSVYVNHGATYGIRRVLSKYDYPCDGSKQSILIQALEPAYMKNIPYINKTNYFTDKTTGILSNFMIEEIDATTDEEAIKYLSSKYVENKKQELTISLGNKTLYKGDKIIRKDGKWYFSYIWKKVDDFSRLVSERIGTQGNFRGSMALGSNFKITDKNNHKNGGMSNILKLTTEGQTYNKSVGFTVGKWGENTTLFFYAEELSEIQTSQELREKISELGAYFVLPLKNEEIEEISYTTLISQLNQLLKLKQYEEVTNVDFDKDVTFEIDILNSNFSKLDNINIAQDEEIEKLKAENQLKGKVINGFTDSYDTEIVEGDNITINDCLNVPIKDFKIYGNESKQEILHINSNLFDENNTTKGIAINSNGIEVTLSTFRISEFIRVKYLITYVLSFIAQSGESQTIRVHFYDENKNWLSQVSIVISKQPERVSFNFEPPQNCKYIRVSIYNGFLDVMVSEGSKNIQFVKHQSETINLTNLPNAENYYIYYDKILYKYFIHNIEILTDIEVTDTILIEQLDKLRAMFLYKGTNHFIVTAENGQPANLKLEAYKDSIKILNDKINNLEQTILNS